MEQPLYSLAVLFNGRPETLHEIGIEYVEHVRRDRRYQITGELTRLPYGTEVHAAKLRDCLVWGAE